MGPREDWALEGTRPPGPLAAADTVSPELAGGWQKPSPSLLLPLIVPLESLLAVTNQKPEDKGASSAHRGQRQVDSRSGGAGEMEPAHYVWVFFQYIHLIYECIAANIRKMLVPLAAVLFTTSWRTCCWQQGLSM